MGVWICQGQAATLIFLILEKGTIRTERKLTPIHVAAYHQCVRWWHGRHEIADVKYTFDT